MTVIFWLFTDFMFMIALFFFLWCYASLHKTAEQRMALLAWIADQEEGLLYFKFFESVSFDQHLKALIWRKDPYALYDRSLISAFQDQTKQKPELRVVN